MLFRASNAVGYTAYPDNVVREFMLEAARAGHRHLPHLRFAELAAEHAGRHGGGARDRTGSAKRPSATPATSSIPTRDKYSLNYYVRMAKELEKMGAHILAIKDMAGLLQPLRRGGAGARRCATRSASRFTSTRTIPAASMRPRS